MLWPKASPFDLDSGLCVRAKLFKNPKGDLECGPAQPSLFHNINAYILPHRFMSFTNTQEEKKIGVFNW